MVFSPLRGGLRARVIAYQLGHARPSMTQNVYMGRKAVDPRAVAALKEALGHCEAGGMDEPPNAINGYEMGLAALHGGGPPPCRPVTCTYGAP
jgi:hypothetical protein